MLDKKYNAAEKEQKWIDYWKDNKIYEFERNGKEVFSIDTPPPTVNGKNSYWTYLFIHSNRNVG